MIKILIFFKSNAYGEYLAKSLLAVEQVTGNMEVRGYITNPSIREHRSDKQFFIVNGRTIKEPLLLKAVSLAYLHVIPRGSHPMIFLRINFKPTGEVDPNVHPRKEQVKFKHKENFFNQIMRVMKDTLQKSFTSSALNNAPETAAELTTAYSPPVFPTRQHDLKEEKFVFKDVADDPYHINHINSPEHLGGNFETPILTPNPSNVSNIFEKSVQVLGQIAKAFIVFAIGEDLFIVDQHAAHERINFDRLLNNIKSQPQINTQMLLIPLLIERSSDDKDTILAASSALAKLGFIIEDFGDNLLRFVEVPTYIPEGKIEAVVNSVLNGVLRRSNVGDLTEEEFLGDSVARMACRMSIMVGDPLSKSAMEDLIHTLYKKGYVYTCPHGRPFVKKISLGEMKLFFDRGRHINGELEN